MSHSTKMQLPYLKKHLIAPKISRFKLQDEFAVRGWNTCSSPFQIKSGESECDIIASPTKYPHFMKSSAHENYSKKKPMLLEISNIESVFLQNKQKSLKLNDDRKLSEAFFDFAPKLTKQEKLNIIHHRKRAQNFHESSKNKKHCNESSKNSNAKYIFSNNSLIKENSPKKESLSVGNRNKNVYDSSVPIESNDPSNVESVHFEKITKRKYSKHDSILQVPNVPLPTLPLKNNQNEVLRTELNKNNKNLNSHSCSENLNSFFHSKDSHLKPHTNLFSDRSLFEKSHCNKKDDLNKSEIFPTILKNNSINEVSTSSISDSPICIQDDSSSESLASSIGSCSPVLFQSCNGNKNEIFLSNSVTMTMSSDSPVSIQDKSSPETAVSPIVAYSPVHSQQQGVDENKKKTSVQKINQVHCELLRLQDLQESFDIKKHEKSLMSDDLLINLISDCTPIKEKNNKQDISLNITNKFKVLSEAFISSSRTDVSNVHRHDSFQNDYSKTDVESRKILPIPKVVPSFNDENSLNEVSEAKNMSVDNKIFMKAIQSSFQEKSCTGDKGSNWVQTLNWDQFSQSKGAEYENNDQIGKKSLKSIIHGGFAEQMLKLQRRERSDRVIWDHKMNELKKKAAANLITFTLTSVIHSGQITITKSTTSDFNNEYLKECLCNKDFHSNNRIADDNLSHEKLPQSQTFIVLFKKEMFTKMHLKLNDEFSLYPPWQFLSVPSLPFPVILCTHFAEAVIKDVESIQKEPLKELSKPQSFPVLYKSLQQKSCECAEPVLSNDYLCNSSDLYNKSVCVSARVQRVWKTDVSNNRLQTVLKLYDHSFILLLQTEDGIFLNLNINSNQLSNAYLEFLLNAEGKCLRFCDLIISRRCNLKRSHHLKSFLQHIQNYSNRDKALSVQQFYCYELIPVSFNKIPNDIHDEKFPFYADYDVQSLSFLQKNDQRDMRFSCIGKIIFQDKKDFYITDESLLCSKGKKYYLLKFENIFKSLLDESSVGSTVLIKDAMCYKGYLFVDKFSSCEILSSSQTNRLRLAYESRMKKIGLITCEHVLSPLTLLSNIKDLVLVKGIISQVDENTAISWLECSFCSGENLLEDSNSVIYCEDCSCIVPKPVLKVKMEVLVQDTCLSNAKVKIQLLSSTVKKILKISEDNYQPECNISDVLKKNTGVLCCYLNAIEVIDKQKVFHLREIRSC